MGDPQRFAESSPDRSLGRHLDFPVKPQGLQSPADRIGNDPSGARRRLAGCKVREQRQPDLAPPRQSSPHCPDCLTPDLRRRQASRVGRAQHELAGRGPGTVELAGEFVEEGSGPASVEPLTAPGKAHPVLLQTVPQAGLGYGLPLLELVDELYDFSQQVTGEFRPEAGAHAAKQQAAEARAGTVL